MIYDMYSRKEQPKQYSELYTIIINDDTLNLVKLPILQEGLIVNSLKQYDYHQLHGEVYWDNALRSRQQRLGNVFTKRSDQLLRYSAADMEAYPVWLKSYLEKHIVHHPIQKWKVLATKLDHEYGFNYKERVIIDVE
ncbi:MAG: hypothetical protein R2730_10525 [Chitinophagales bacterium]